MTNLYTITVIWCSEVARVIVDHEGWEDCLRACTTLNGVENTPFRRMIRKMPGNVTSLIVVTKGYPTVCWCCIVYHTSRKPFKGTLAYQPNFFSIITLINSRVVSVSFSHTDLCMLAWYIITRHCKTLPLLQRMLHEGPFCVLSTSHAYIRHVEWCG